MKKLLFVLVGIVLLTSLFAEVNFYGKVRTGAWYTFENEDYTGGKSKIELTSGIYKATKLGLNYNENNFKAKVEVGFADSNAVYLRLFYGEYNFGKMKLLFGQDFTGFTSANYSTQAYLSVDNGTTDLANVGYGAFFDSRIPMIKLIVDDAFFIAFMKPNKVNPNVFESDDAIDALIPKTNFGANLKFDKLSIKPTFGINYSKYNKDRTATKIDDSVLAYAFSLSGDYQMDKLFIKMQANFGQNVKDYGIKGYQNAKALWSANKGEVINTVTYGGFMQVRLDFDKNLNSVFGFGYAANKNDNLNDADGCMDFFLQTNIKFSKNFCFTPEIGFINEMEDGEGNKEGSILYFGSRLQAKF